MLPRVPAQRVGNGARSLDQEKPFLFSATHGLSAHRL